MLNSFNSPLITQWINLAFSERHNLMHSGWQLYMKLAFVTKPPSILERVQVLVSIDSRNGLSPFDTKTFLESLLTL